MRLGRPVKSWVRLTMFLVGYKQIGSDFVFSLAFRIRLDILIWRCYYYYISSNLQQSKAPLALKPLTKWPRESPWWSQPLWANWIIIPYNPRVLVWWEITINTPPMVDGKSITSYGKAGGGLFTAGSPMTNHYHLCMSPSSWAHIKSLVHHIMNPYLTNNHDMVGINHH